MLDAFHAAWDQVVMEECAKDEMFKKTWDDLQAFRAEYKVYSDLGFVAMAWHVNESSPSPLGMPYWWIIKSVIPLTMFVVILAALPRIVRAVAVIIQINKEQRRG